MANKDIRIALNAIGNFFLLNSSSSEPSSTISISPTVPNTGNTPDRSGTLICEFLAKNCSNNPDTMSRKIEGILVFDAVMSKT